MVGRFREDDTLFSLRQLRHDPTACAISSVPLASRRLRLQGRTSVMRWHFFSGGQVMGGAGQKVYWGFKIALTLGPPRSNTMCWSP